MFSSIFTKNVKAVSECLQGSVGGRLTDHVDVIPGLHPLDLDPAASSTRVAPDLQRRLVVLDHRAPHGLVGLVLQILDGVSEAGYHRGLGAAVTQSRVTVLDIIVCLLAASSEGSKVIWRLPAELGVEAGPRPRVRRGLGVVRAAHRVEAEA